MTGLFQILLAVISLTITFLITFAAIQVFHILHDFRQTLQKLNRILDHTHTLSNSASKPVAAVNDFFTEVKELVSETQDEIIKSTPDRVISSSHPKPRFFHRSGSPLHAS